MSKVVTAGAEDRPECFGEYPCDNCNDCTPMIKIACMETSPEVKRDRQT